MTQENTEKYLCLNTIYMPCCKCGSAQCQCAYLTAGRDNGADSFISFSRYDFIDVVIFILFIDIF
jgi:hypothetical protein